ILFCSAFLWRDASNLATPADCKSAKQQTAICATAMEFILDGAGPRVTVPFMTTQAPSAPKKINLRRPDIMEAVQAQVLSHYRSELVERIRANGHVFSADGLTIKLAKEFGFCYGVERAIDLAYAARKSFPADK